MPTLILRLLAALAAVVLVAAGCGDDDDLDAVSDTVEDGVAEEVDEARDQLKERVDELGLTSLSSALAEIDVAELADTETFTFFAPGDDAFTGATADELTDLLADPERLEETVRNHILDERIEAADLVERSSVTAVTGRELEVVVDGDVVTVGGVTVTSTDQEAGEGVIHVVDGLIVAE